MLPIKKLRHLQVAASWIFKMSFRNSAVWKYLPLRLKIDILEDLNDHYGILNILKIQYIL